MELSQNFFSLTQNFFSPDTVQKFSGEIHQPPEQTKAGLKSIVPALLMGIVNKGSTQAGAENLINLANKQSSDPTLTPDRVNPAEGNAVVNGIFGNETNSIVEKISSTTGLGSSNISKMMSLAAPMIMGVLGSKIKSEKLGPSGLMSFLQQQKSSISGLLPGSLGALGGLGAGLGAKASSLSSSVGSTMSSTTDKYNEKYKSKPWGKILVGLALAVIAYLWWFNSRQDTAVAPVSTPAVVATAVAPDVVPSVSGLDTFFSSSTSGTSGRFRFDNLNFTTATTTLASGADVELNQIAASMKKFPETTARIEGFTDNIGAPSTNQTLSLNRALEVKRQLVNRGIDAGRIEAVGLGAASPLATNATEEGRAQNRRIEFIAIK